jgi:hypothetical protein
MPASVLRGIAVAAALAAAGCTTVPKVDQVNVDETHLDGGRRTPVLACPWRLARVVDARPADADSGNLGAKVLHVEDPAGVIARQLYDAGFKSAESAEGREVVVELKQLYMSQMYEVKIPVAVYGVTVPGEAPFVVRSEASSISWVGSSKEATYGLARAINHANVRLMQALNERCRKG